VAADIAFLAMDLEFRGRQDLSDCLMTNYVSATQDSKLPLLMPFYKCYRAYVRGKVDGFQIDQPEIAESQRREATLIAMQYFNLAHTYARQPSPHALFITVGATGSGKSYLANALASRIGAALLSSDVTRKALMGVESTERHWESYEAGIYAPEITQRTYGVLLNEARSWLERGKPVVIDASFLKRDHRSSALRLAFDAGAAFLAIECEADEATIVDRLSERRGDERVVSDGRWEIYRSQQEHRDPLDELPPGTNGTIETTLPLRAQVDHVLERIREQVPGASGSR
jgi:predicted kinase